MRTGSLSSGAQCFLTARRSVDVVLTPSTSGRPAPPKGCRSPRPVRDNRGASAYAHRVIDDRDRDLGTVLSYLVGRPVRTVELAKALGVARSSYYAARDEKRLITADNLLRLADVFGINPVDLLVRYGLVSHNAAVEYAQAAGAVPATAGTADPAGLRPRMDLPPL